MTSTAPLPETLLRPATPEDTAFAPLMRVSDSEFMPGVFSRHFDAVMQRSFIRTDVLFSYRHVTVAVRGNSVVGMTLVFDRRDIDRESPMTGLTLLAIMGSAFFPALPGLIASGSLMGAIARGELYLSNIAVDTAAQGSGIGRMLMDDVDVQAKARNAKRILLDVRSGNIGAIRLYERCGYRHSFTRTINIGKAFSYDRMIKDL